MDILRGDCFANLSFMNTEDDADETLEKTCKQVCAHSSWIRYVYQLSPKNLIDGIQHEKVLITTSDDQWLKYWTCNDGIMLHKTKIDFGVNVIQELLCDQDLTSIDTESKSSLSKQTVFQYIILAGELGSIAIYDYSSNKIIKSLEGSSKNVLTVRVMYDKNYSFSMKTSIILSGHSNGELRLWNWSKGQTVRRFKMGVMPAHGLDMWYLSKQPKGNTLRAIVSSQDNNMYIWDPVKMRKYRQVDGHSNWIRTLACNTFESDYEGKIQKFGLIISAGDDCTIRLYNIFKGGCVRVFEMHKTGIIHLEVIDEHLFSCDTGGTVVLTSLRSQKSTYVKTGLSLDFYRSFSLHKGDDDQVNLFVAGALPRRAYHFLNVYPGKRLGMEGFDFRVEVK